MDIFQSILYENQSRLETVEDESKNIDQDVLGVYFYINFTLMFICKPCYLIALKNTTTSVSVFLLWLMMLYCAIL